MTRFNVGVGVWLRDYRPARHNVSALMQLFTDKNTRARVLAGHAVAREKPRGFHLAGAQRGTRVALGKVLKVGDAANLTDPISGEGIQNALTSGLLVAEAINCSVSPEDVADNWQRIYDDHFVDHLRAGLRLGSLLRHNMFKNVVVWAMNRDGRIAERVNAGLFDLVRYNDLGPSLARSLRAPKPPAELKPAEVKVAKAATLASRRA